MSRAAWELVFMMLILKIPLVYLGLVVWYAIRAEPEPGVDPTEYSIWRPWRSPTARGRAAAARTARATPHGRNAPAAIESRRDARRPAETGTRREAIAGLMAAGALFLGVVRALLPAVPARARRRDPAAHRDGDEHSASSV